MTDWLDKVNQIISNRLAEDPHYYDDPATTIRVPNPDPRLPEYIAAHDAIYSHASNSGVWPMASRPPLFHTWTRSGLRKVTVTFIVDEDTGQVYEPVRETRP